MCQFQKIYGGVEGYVIRCSGCHHYQLLFGGVVLTMSDKEFAKFLEVVDGLENDYLICSAMAEVPIPAMRQGVHLLLNQQKISQLRHMLQEADAEASTQSLLQLFHEP